MVKIQRNIGYLGCLRVFPQENGNVRKRRESACSRRKRARRALRVLGVNAPRTWTERRLRHACPRGTRGGRLRSEARTLLPHRRNLDLAMGRIQTVPNGERRYEVAGQGTPRSGRTEAEPRQEPRRRRVIGVRHRDGPR